MEVINLDCPGCGAPVSTKHKNCEYCSRPIVITSVSSVSAFSPLELNKYASAYRKTLAANPDNKEINGSIAVCYLKLKLYDNAIAAFGKAIEDNFDNPELYYCAAISLLRGKKAFVCSRSDIDKILEYLNAAIMIKPRGIYYYFLAYIKQDYFERKYLNITPNYKEHLEQSAQLGVSEDEIQQLATMLQVEMPECLRI